MRKPISFEMRERARAMRSDMTEAERRLWQAIRARRLMGLRFRRQIVLGDYIVDFVCPSHRLIIELDGSQHGEDDAAFYDDRRTKWLEEEGYTVLRFWNDDVMRDLDGVCSHIVGVVEKLGRKL